MNEIAKLRERWDPRTVDLINQSLGKGKRITSPFGIIDGRIDLRGISLRTFVKGQRIESCDFTGAIREWVGQIGTSTLIDCLFIGAMIDTNLGTRFEGCVFDSAKMKGVVLRGDFVDCSFQKANLASALGDSVRFERCSFDAANLKKAQLTASKFIDCSFLDASFGSGSLASSVFIGSCPSRDQFGTTLLENCSVPATQE